MASRVRKVASTSEAVPVLGEIRSATDAVALIDRRRRGLLYRAFGAGAPIGRYAFPRNLWFRGARAAEHALVPPVFRHAPRGVDERELALEARRFLPDQALGDLPDPELLAVLQHHGCPTRLLDWSESLLLALWFALTDDFARGTPSTDRDGRLFVLAPLRLNREAVLDPTREGAMLREDDPDVILRAAMALEVRADGWRARCAAPSVRRRLAHPEALDAALAMLAGGERSRPRAPSAAWASLALPVAFACRLHTPRMHGQQGVFTLAGGKPPAAIGAGRRDLLPRPRPLPVRDRRGALVIASLRIPGACKADLLRQLLDLGIDPLRIAPGVEGAMAAALSHTRGPRAADARGIQPRARRPSRRASRAQKVDAGS